MKILLVTTVDNLAEKFAVLNPELNYCALVTDKRELAKEILDKLDLSNVPLYPMSELKTCFENLIYDYIFCVQDVPYGTEIVSILQKYNLPTEKVMSFSIAGNWQTEFLIRYYQTHAKDFEMFATGTSYTEAGVDIRKFKRNTINFATSSQDLYYSFQIAKSVVLCGRGHSMIRYALIGLAPYVFHFDLSKTFVFKARVLPYLIAFNDIHNFPVPIDIYKNFFREEWLTSKPSIQKVNINGVNSPKVMDNSEISTSKGIPPWDKKYYPETLNENTKILDDYLMLCEENNIRPVLFVACSSEKFIGNFNKQMLEEFYILVEQALQKHPSARFVDGWKWNGVTYADFYDHGHMNIYGAAKFSAYLNDFIEKLEQKVQ